MKVLIFDERENIGEEIEFPKKLRSQLWSVLFDFLSKDLSVDFYLDIYNKMKYELGTPIDYSLEVIDLRRSINLNCFVFIEYFRIMYSKFTDVEIMSFIEIVVNSIYNAYLEMIYDSVLKCTELKVKSTCDCDIYLNDLDLGNLNCVYEELKLMLCKINEKLRVHDIDFFLNSNIAVDFNFSIGDFKSFYSQKRDVQNNIIFIKKTHNIMSDKVVNSCLNLLNDIRFKAANSEFLNAMDLYNVGKYKDCVNSMTRSYESVLKIICSGLGYKFKGNEQLSELVNIIIKNAFFDFFSKDQTESLKVVLQKSTGFIRNSSAAHGDGVIEKVVNEETVKYVINMTCTFILYLVDIYEVKLNKDVL